MFGIKPEWFKIAEGEIGWMETLQKMRDTEKDKNKIKRIDDEIRRSTQKMREIYFKGVRGE